MKIECRTYLYYVTFLSVLLAAILSLGGCTDPAKAKAAHLAKGEAYLKESKFQEASIEFRNAIQIDDKFAAAHWGLAQAYEGMQRGPETVEELRRATQLDPNNLDARLKLGTYYVAGSAGREDVIAEAERLAKEVLAKDPKNIEGHILMGTVLFTQNNRGGAFTELSDAIALDPKRVESYLSLAKFYVVTNDQAKADETFQRAISINNNSGLAHTEYGKFLVRSGKAVEAEAELRKAVEVEPANRDSRFVLASFYLLNKQFDKAEEAYKALADLDKNKPESQSVLADFYALANRPDQAIKTYQQLLANSPDYLRGRYRLAEILLTRGDLQGASAQIEEVLKKDQHDREALVLRARVHLQRGQTNDLQLALEDLKEVLRQEPNSRAGLYFMAQVNYALGLTDQARAFAGDLDRNYPNYLPGKLIQVHISIAAGDPKAALRIASDLLERLDKTAVDQENTPQLLAELREKTLLARGSAQGHLGNFKAARQDFMAAREIFPNDTDVNNNLATVSRAEAKPDEAIGFYENSLAVDATNFNALNGLIGVYANKHELDKAHARLDQALNSTPQNASLHFLKAQIYGYELNNQGAESELRKTVELDQNYLNAYYSLAALYLNTNQGDRAIAEYQKVLERRPDSASAYTLIGMIEDARKNYDAAAENYRKTLALDPNSAIAANNLAWLYATSGKGNLDEAVRLAQGVVEKNPNAAGFVDTLGWVYYKKGLFGAAADQLQKAVDLNQAAARSSGGLASPVYPYHLGMALKARGDREGARRQLQEALRLGEVAEKQTKVPFADAEEARKALATP